MEQEQEQGKKFVIQIVGNEEEWTRIVLKQTFLKPESAGRVLAIWTNILDRDRDSLMDKTHVYINRKRMEEYDYPEGGVDCKIIHETTEAELVDKGLSLPEAHCQAKEAEYRKAKDLGILDPYSKAEDRFDSDHRLRKEKALKRKVLRRLRKITTQL